MISSRNSILRLSAALLGGLLLRLARR